MFDAENLTAAQPVGDTRSTGAACCPASGALLKFLSIQHGTGGFCLDVASAGLVRRHDPHRGHFNGQPCKNNERAAMVIAVCLGALGRHRMKTTHCDLLSPELLSESVSRRQAGAQR